MKFNYLFNLQSKSDYEIVNRLEKESSWLAEWKSSKKGIF